MHQVEHQGTCTPTCNITQRRKPPQECKRVSYELHCADYGLLPHRIISKICEDQFIIGFGSHAAMTTQVGSIVALEVVCLPMPFKITFGASVGVPIKASPELLQRVDGSRIVCQQVPQSFATLGKEIMRYHCKYEPVVPTASGSRSGHPTEDEQFLRLAVANGDQTIGINHNRSHGGRRRWCTLFDG